MQERIVFIGAGNMAEALVSGLIRKGIAGADRIRVTDVREDRRAYFRAAYGVEGLADNRAAVADADVVVLAVKPQGMRGVLTEIQSAVTDRHLVISIAAGIPVRLIEESLTDGVRVIRSMPNTPALVGSGVAAICAGSRATDSDLERADQLLGATGAVVRVDEGLMDAVTAISGSGPAYVFYLMEAMLESAQRMGLEDQDALQLVTGTVEGAARLVRETGLSPAELRERVTSKGGTTAAALSVMKEEDIFDHLVTAIMAAEQRARELSSGG
jgi:pyrroline-5-carboxylate reductase